MEYSPVACMRQGSRCCRSDSLGCSPRNFPLARAMAMLSRVHMRMRSASNSGEGGEDIEEHLSHGIARVVEGQFHASFPKPIGDGAGIRDGPCQPVEFRHDQGVAGAHGGEGLVVAGSGAVRAGEAVTGVDAIFGDAQLQEGLALGGRVLQVGGTASVSDASCRHGGSVRIGSRFRNYFRTIHMRRCWHRFGVGSGRRAGPSAGGSPYGQRHACRNKWITGKRKKSLTKTTSVPLPAHL